MKIGIIGAGQIGGTLARRLTAMGHEVFVANSRGPETLSDLAAETGATAVSVPKAVQGVNLVVVTIPEKNIPNLPAGLFADTPAGVVVVDTGNYYPRQRDGRIEAIEAGLPESKWVEQQVSSQQHLCQTPAGVGPAQGRCRSDCLAGCGRRPGSQSHRPKANR